MSEIGPATWFIGALLAQRLIEFWLARRNTERLLEAGGVEFGEAVYPPSMMLLAAWLVALAVSTNVETVPLWPLVAVAALLQLLRVWTLLALGRRWTPRVIRIPGDAPVSAGPYRFCRHPYEAIVAAEYLIVPLAVGLWWLSAAATVANIPLLRERLRAERAAAAIRPPASAACGPRDAP
jgi:methyltransferase